MENSKQRIIRQATTKNETAAGSENKFPIGKRIAAAAVTTIIIAVATDDNNGDTHRRSGLRVIFPRK